MGKKNPILAAVLSFVLGPLGYLYIGWRYAVATLVVFSIFIFVLAIADLPLPEWMKYIILIVLAWKAFHIVTVRNQLIDCGDDIAGTLGTFTAAIMAASDLLVGVGTLYAGAIGLYASAIVTFQGDILKGLFVLVLGTPVLVWIANLVFGVVAMGLDFVAVALSPSGTNNPFRV